jgi:hypothetical protein
MTAWQTYACGEAGLCSSELSGLWRFCCSRILQGLLRLRTLGSLRLRGCQRVYAVVLPASPARSNRLRDRRAIGEWNSEESKPGSPLIGFFSEIFAANPTRFPEWQSLIAKQDDQTKAVLDQALKLSKSEGVLHSSGHSPQLKDAYWGAFFATGNLKFVDKVVDQVKYFDERTDEALFFAGATAMWSLASNARTYTLVNSAVEGAKVNAD